MRTFEEIARAHGTDKVTEHDFGPVYERHLEGLRGESLVLFEIGVHRGASLRTWLEYIPGADIHGFDNDPKCMPTGGYGFRTHLVDVMSQAFRNLAKALPAPDVVVDDGGHWPKEQRAAFRALWPRLKPGGLYFVEDLQVKREKDFAGDVSAWAGSVLRTEGNDMGEVHCYPEICVIVKGD